MNEPTTQSSGMSFTTWLTLMFIGLKLTGYVTWSWWWVLAPMWIQTLVALVVLGVGIALLQKRESPSVPMPTEERRRPPVLHGKN